MTGVPEKDLEKVKKRYIDRFKRFGVDVRTLNSGGREKQNIRHQVHSEIGSLSEKSILDVGTGLAEYYQFLNAKNIKFHYTGYDIVAEFIDANRQRFPGVRFEKRNIFEEDIDGTYHYICMSQVFNNHYQGVKNEEVVAEALRLAFNASTIGVSIDMMTSYVDYTEEHLYYYHPSTMFELAKKFTPFVVLRHDYLPYEFTLYLYHQSPYFR